MPGLGALRLSLLERATIQTYLAKKLGCGRLDGKGGLSRRTVRHHLVTLHGALESAVKWGILNRNPTDAVDAPKYQSPEMKTLDEEGLGAFLDAARETPYYQPFYLALYTGLRRSELLGLRWNDVDLDRSYLYVNRGLTRVRELGSVVRKPKTSKGSRMVALPPSAALVLRVHKESQAAQRLLIGDQPLEEDDPVFTRPDGSPMLPDTVAHAWLKLARRTGFYGIRLHDARHSHATLLLKQGVHPKIVQERLGHATIATTLDTYSHVSPGLQEAAALRFDDLAARPESIPADEAVDRVR